MEKRRAMSIQEEDKVAALLFLTSRKLRVRGNSRIC